MLRVEFLEACGFVLVFVLQGVGVVRRFEGGPAVCLSVPYGAAFGFYPAEKQQETAGANEDNGRPPPERQP